MASGEAFSLCCICVELYRAGRRWNGLIEGFVLEVNFRQ